MVALPRVLSASTSNSGKPTLDEKQQPVTEDDLNLIEEVLNFATNCPICGNPAETKMKVTSEFAQGVSLKKPIYKLFPLIYKRFIF